MSAARFLLFVETMRFLMAIMMVELVLCLLFCAASKLLEPWTSLTCKLAMM